MNEVLNLQPAPANGAISRYRFDPADAARRDYLDSTGILDSAPEKAFDDIARLAAFVCGAAVALISFFDPPRQWVKTCFSGVALAQPVESLPWSAGFCALSIEQPDGVLIVPNLATDPRFAGQRLLPPAVPARFYAAVPLRAASGIVIGTLCVLDRKTRSLTREQVAALETLGRQVLELLEMRRTVVGLSQANAVLGRQSFTDALTGIPNRRALDQKLAEEVSRAKRTGTPLSLLMIDIDHFKQYNDAHGHPAGDTALATMARVLLAALRPYDFLARYGGEEFAIVLPGTEIADALLVAERVRTLVSRAEFPLRKFTVSIGAARLDAESGLKALLQAADDGLYRAKGAGRNRVMTGQAQLVLV